MIWRFLILSNKTLEWQPKAFIYAHSHTGDSHMIWGSMFSMHIGDTDDVGCSQRHLSKRTQNRSIQTSTILLCKDDSIVEPALSLVWADAILVDFQRDISHYLQDIGTYLSCTARRVLRTIFMQNPSRNMHVSPAKSSMFESTNFASVMIDDVGCSRRHQCPRCA